MPGPRKGRHRVFSTQLGVMRCPLGERGHVSKNRGRMGCGAYIRIDERHFAIFSNQKAATRIKAQPRRNPEGLGPGSILVGHQRKRKIVLIRKAPMRFGAIARDPDDTDLGPLVFFPGVAQRARLFCSTRSIVFGVEIHERDQSRIPPQSQRITPVVCRLKIRNLAPHHNRLGVFAGSPRPAGTGALRGGSQPQQEHAKYSCQGPAHRQRVYPKVVKTSVVAADPPTSRDLDSPMLTL